MQAGFDEAMLCKQRIQADADATHNRINAANRLISNLAGEQARWSEQAEAFSGELLRLTGDAAIACAFIAYAGPFNSEFRAKLRERFVAEAARHGIATSAELDVIGFLADKATVSVRPSRL